MFDSKLNFVADFSANGNYRLGQVVIYLDELLVHLKHLLLVAKAIK